MYKDEESYNNNTSVNVETVTAAEQFSTMLNGLSTSFMRTLNQQLAQTLEVVYAYRKAEEEKRFSGLLILDDLEREKNISISEYRNNGFTHLFIRRIVNILWRDVVSKPSRRLYIRAINKAYNANLSPEEFSNVLNDKSLTRFTNGNDPKPSNLVNGQHYEDLYISQFKSNGSITEQYPYAMVRSNANGVESHNTAQKKTDGVANINGFNVILEIKSQSTQSGTAINNVAHAVTKLRNNEIFINKKISSERLLIVIAGGQMEEYAKNELSNIRYRTFVENKRSDKEIFIITDQQVSDVVEKLSQLEFGNYPSAKAFLRNISYSDIKDFQGFEYFE